MANILDYIGEQISKLNTTIDDNSLLKDEARLSEAENKAKKIQALKQVADFFTNDNDIIKRIQKTYEEIKDYLADYVAKGLK